MFFIKVRNFFCCNEKFVQNSISKFKDSKLEDFKHIKQKDTRVDKFVAAVYFYLLPIIFCVLLSSKSISDENQTKFILGWYSFLLIYLIRTTIFIIIKNEDFKSYFSHKWRKGRYVYNLIRFCIDIVKLIFYLPYLLIMFLFIALNSNINRIKRYILMSVASVYLFYEILEKFIFLLYDALVYWDIKFWLTTISKLFSIIFLVVVSYLFSSLYWFIYKKNFFTLNKIKLLSSKNFKIIFSIILSIHIYILMIFYIRHESERSLQFQNKLREVVCITKTSKILDQNDIRIDSFCNANTKSDNKIIPYSVAKFFLTIFSLMATILISFWYYLEHRYSNMKSTNIPKDKKQ